MMKIQEFAIRMHVAWERFKAEERGAQTLEWLALALLILAILGAASSLGGGGFSTALKEKFIGMVNNINPK